MNFFLWSERGTLLLFLFLPSSTFFSMGEIAFSSLLVRLSLRQKSGRLRPPEIEIGVSAAAAFSSFFWGKKRLETVIFFHVTSELLSLSPHCGGKASFEKGMGWGGGWERENFSSMKWVK